MEGGHASDWRSSFSLSLREHQTVQIYHALFPLSTFSQGLQFQAARLERDVFNASRSESEYVTKVANFVYFLHDSRITLHETFLSDFTTMVVNRYNYENVGLAMPYVFPAPPDGHQP